MMLLVKTGATSVRLQVFLADATVTTGAGKTGLTNSSVTAYYFRDGDATATVHTLAAGTVGTWSSGGFKEIDATNLPGWYEIGIFNAVFANTVRQASVMIKATGTIVPVNIMFQLVPWDPQDSVRLGLTSMPNVAAGAAGGVVTDTNSSGQLQGVHGNVTGSVGSVTGAVGSVTGNVGGNVTGSVASVTAAVSLAAPDSQILAQGTASAGTSTTITLAGASATNSFYNGTLVKISSGTGAGQSRYISAYVGATKVATVATAWTTTPDATSVFQVMAGDDVSPVVASSVTGSVGSVTGAVGSVTGNVGGNVVGSVGSVTAGVTVTTNNDKTGYSLTVTPPTAAQIAAVILVTPANLIATNASNQVVASSVQGNVTGSVASVTGAVGSVTGAVGSVTGAVGSVTGAVGSVTGNVGGNVVGSVASVTAGVTVTTNNDKTGYALTTAEHTAIQTDAATGVLDTADSVDNAVNANTVRKWMRIWNSVLAGIASGQGTTTAVFKNQGNTKTRVSATVDTSGNRTAIGTLDGS